MTRSAEEHETARRLRSKGMPYKRIAAELGVSVGSAFLWTSDIELTEEQLERNRRGSGGPQNPESQRRRAAASLIDGVLPHAAPRQLQQVEPVGLDLLPTSSSGRARNKLPYGVCTLRVHSTWMVQHIYGAIQEYGGFDEPAWLD
jgi:hypothetical protein